MSGLYAKVEEEEGMDVAHGFDGEEFLKAQQSPPPSHAQTLQRLQARSYDTYTPENELTLLKQIIGVFTLRNRQLDEQDESKPTEYTHMPYLDDQKFILLVSMIFTARDIFHSEEYVVFKKFPAGQQFSQQPQLIVCQYVL